MRTIGRSQPRIDARDKVTGAALYPADIPHRSMLSALAVFSDQAHARMLSIDLSAARAVDGVVEIFTAGDVPVNEYGLTMFDQPVMVGVGSTGRSPVPSDVSRWEADQIALVVAETPEAAHAAAAAMAVEWEQLPIIDDVDAAMATDAPLLHPENGHATNEYLHYKTRYGDVARGWSEAVVTVEGTYEFPHQEHAYLQPEAAVSYVDDEGRVTVEIAGQWTWEDLTQIAHALDLPESEIRIVYPAIGGAFGGREDMTLQIVMALAAWKLAERGETRPIRTVWSREESIVGHHKRHRGRVTARIGADADGRITVVEADAVLDAGSYNYTTNKVLGNLHVTLAGAYRIPNARIDSRGVYTTSVPGGAFRGFGAPQGAFVLETQINKLAQAVGIDPVELRRRNFLSDGDETVLHTPLPLGVTIDEVVARAAAEGDWGEPVPEREPVRPFRTLGGGRTLSGRGIACGIKNIGFSFGFPERSDARVVLHGDERVESVDLFAGAADVGQGTHTALRQIAAEALGVDVDSVTTHYSDTATSGDSGSASASRLTFMQGNAVLGASEEAQKRWIEGDRPAIGEFRYTPPSTQPLDPEGGPSMPNFCYGYTAQVVDLSVDVDTGVIRVDRVVSVTDVGRTINPQMVEGQTEGAVVQAHGYAVTENLQSAAGRILNPRFSQYLIPGIGDIPTEVETVHFESADPLGPFGARGMAEMPYIPYTPALVAALHDATGVWFDGFPLTPDRVAKGLKGAV
jgi:CO/xanthine dehydrogenase Mo-binding subunit